MLHASSRRCAAVVGVVALAVGATMTVSSSSAAAQTAREAAGAVNVFDTFLRPVTSGFGAAPVGGAWSLTPGGAPAVDGTGAHTGSLPAATQFEAFVPDVVNADEQVSMAFAVAARPTAGSHYVGMSLRRVSGDGAFFVRVKEQVADGDLLQIIQVRANVQTTIATETIPNLVAGHSYTLEGTVAGGNGAASLTATLADAASADVSGTTLAGSITSNAIASGSFGLYAYAGGGSSPENVTFTRFAGTNRSITTPPGASTTGIPAGTTTTTVTGDQTFSQAGQLVQNINFEGFVSVRAPNVTFRNCIFRGANATASPQRALLFSNAVGRGLVVQDSTFVPRYPSKWIGWGIQASDFTALRDDVSGGIDGIDFDGDNGSIVNSYVHGLKWYESDPGQNGNPSHNDGTQTFGYAHSYVGGTHYVGLTNADVVDPGPGRGPGSDLQTGAGSSQQEADFLWVHNWHENAFCQINVGGVMSAVGLTFVDNRFYPNSATTNCAIIDYASSDNLIVMRNNTWTDTGLPIKFCHSPGSCTR